MDLGLQSNGGEVFWLTVDAAPQLLMMGSVIN